MFSFLCYSFFTNKEIGGWPEFSSKMCKLPKNWPHSCPHRQRKDIFSVRATKNFFENFEMGTNFFACSSSSSSSSSTYFHVVKKRFPIEPKKYYFWHLSLVVSELKIFQKKTAMWVSKCYGTTHVQKMKKNLWMKKCYY